jgi:hypothetical protein
MSILEKSQYIKVFQGEFFCMGETQAKKSGLRPFPSFVFVHNDDGRKRSPMPFQVEPWWLRFSKWVQYHGIQLRWDIERSLARLFNRRWGG